MKSISKRLYVVILAIICVLLPVWFSLYAPERISSYKTPDGVHIHQVYKNYPVTEDFTATARGLSGIGVFASSINSAQVIHIVIRAVTENMVISEQDIQAKNLNHIPVPRQAMSVGKRYSITISLNADKTHAIKILYQSDPTIDPTSSVSQAGIKKQGSLGLIEYERPTFGLQFSRWLALPHQRTLWVEIVICIIGFVLQRKKTASYSPPYEGGVRGGYTYLYFGLIILSAIVMYWPATHLFFYSDDVPILARVSVLWQHQPLLLLTPHRYTDPDPQSQFGFDFYRPISFSLYPLLLHLLFPPNPGLYYFFNIILFSGIACCLFEISKRIIHSTPASFLLILLWMSHSSKLGLLYWWSSIQDLLASLFAMLSLVLYFKWKESENKIFLKLSITSFVIALFSKEYIIVTPLIIASINLIESSISKQRILSTIRNISPYILAAGIFLVINTAMLGDPTLPEHKQTDQTYSLSLEPINIIRNSIVYSSFTAEQRLWPQIHVTKSFENKLSTILELWRLKTSGPYYPGIVLFLAAFVVIAIFWRNKQLRTTLCIAYIWWLLYIAPFLLFTSDWRPRWLTLATFGSSLVLIIVLQQIIPKKMYIVWYVLAGMVFLYGYNTARDQNLTRFFREQSAYTQQAYIQLTQQEKNISDEKRIILVGITPDQKTSLNAYLFRLYAKNPNTDIIYADVVPTRKEQGDVIINMTGIIPYYPESEK